jgi:hypothetical protein
MKQTRGTLAPSDKDDLVHDEIVRILTEAYEAGREEARQA